MVCDFCEFPIFPSGKTLCPASPSLQWVAKVSLPHLPVQQSITEHRYYDPLRLPNVHPGFVRSSLSAPDTLYRPSLCLCLLSQPQNSLTGRTFLISAGISPIAGFPNTVLLRKETFGSPKFPSYPFEHMPWSQTPVVS